MLQDKYQNLIVLGPAGSGKSLICSEAFKMKVAECKNQGIPIHPIITTYHSNTDYFLEDLKTKFNLNYLMEEFGIEPITFEALAHGEWSVHMNVFLFYFN